MSADRCCGGRCRRAQPPMVMRGGLTGRWYVVLRYKDLGDGSYEAIEKHELAGVSAEVLDRLVDHQCDPSQPADALAAEESGSQRSSTETPTVESAE